MGPEPRALPRELFLAHASQDRAFVDGLVGALRGHGVAVWYGPTDLVGGQQWYDEIRRALDRCDWFGVILSPNAWASRWVRRELRYPLDEERYDDATIPILFRPRDLRRFSWALADYQHVDFTGDLHAGCRDLLRIWGLGDRPTS